MTPSSHTEWPSDRVPAAADGDRQIALAGEPQRLLDVVGARAARDQRRPAVDRAVPDPPGLVVALLAGSQERAAEPPRRAAASVRGSSSRDVMGMRSHGGRPTVPQAFLGASRARRERHRALLLRGLDRTPQLGLDLGGRGIEGVEEAGAQAADLGGPRLRAVARPRPRGRPPPGPPAGRPPARTPRPGRGRAGPARRERPAARARRRPRRGGRGRALPRRDRRARRDSPRGPRRRARPALPRSRPAPRHARAAVRRRAGRAP